MRIGEKENLMSAAVQKSEGPTTIRQLLELAKKKSDAGENQVDIILWIGAVTKKLGIYVYFDEFFRDSKTSGTEVKDIGDTETKAVEAGDTKSVPKQKAKDVDETENVEEKDVEAGDTKSIPKQKSKKSKKGKIVVPIHRTEDGSQIMILEEILQGAEFGKPMSHDPDESSVPRGGDGSLTCRMVFTTDRYPKHPNPICAESNGYVVDARTWTPLAIPPRAFCPNPKPTEINKFLKERLYDVIMVDDGTVVTLYQWNHPTDGAQWDMATANGYGMSSMRWMGPKTYAEIVFEVASKYPEFVKATEMRLVVDDNNTRIEFGKLDPKFCYTLGFRHHDFHPLRQDPERMWQIQSVNLETGKIDYSAKLPGIPEQTIEVKAALHDSHAHEESSREVDIKFDTLRMRTDLALDDAKKLIKTTSEGVVSQINVSEKNQINVSEKKQIKERFEIKERFNYGYILRSVDPERTGPQSDILLESNLLRVIRRIAYDRPPRAVRNVITSESRLRYHSFRTFMMEDRKHAEELFPEWEKEFQKIDQFIRDLVRGVEHVLRQRGRPVSREPRGQTPMSALVKGLATHITKQEHINVFQKNIDSILRDFIVSPNYAHLYMFVYDAMRRLSRSS